MLSSLSFPALLAACATAIACGTLSVFVVLRRLALVGEGVGHSAVGGAGFAWLLACAWPPVDRPGVWYAAAAGGAIFSAACIGWLARPGRERAGTDAAIGIFIVASLAFGFLARSVYVQQRHMEPAGFADVVFGQMSDITPAYAAAATCLAAGVVLVVTLLGKELLAYCYDPVLAEASGVRAGFVHYLLMGLIGLMVIIGLRVTGSVLVTALLVLPGATAVRLTRRFGHTVAIAVALGIASAAGGVTIHAQWTPIPAGPAIVLLLFLAFLATLPLRRAA